MKNENLKFLWCAMRASGNIQLIMASSREDAINAANCEWSEWAEYDGLAAVWVATPEDVQTNQEAKAYNY